jgi:hypothetical protein
MTKSIDERAELLSSMKHRKELHGEVTERTGTASVRLHVFPMSPHRWPLSCVVQTKVEVFAGDYPTNCRLNLMVDTVRLFPDDVDQFANAYDELIMSITQKIYEAQMLSAAEKKLAQQALQNLQTED